jgi:hypothetical protein
MVCARPTRVLCFDLERACWSWMGCRQTALARNGADWLALGAQHVERGGQTVFRASLPTDVTWEHAASGIQLTANAPDKGELKIFSASAPASVCVDGKPIPIAYEGNMITVPLLLPGEHHVSIQ